MARVPDEADPLFDLPASEFVAARNELLRRLRSDGEVDAVEAVGSLRRPTLAAWAVNQVVREDPDRFEELVASGRAAQKAQRRALSGVSGSGLRAAAGARRGLVEALTDRAVDVLTAAGAAPASHVDDIAATFEAATVDPDTAERIGAGRLSAPVHVSTDFSGAAALRPVSAPADDEYAGHGDDGGEGELARRRRSAILTLEAARRRADESARAANASRAEADALDARAAQARLAVDAARAAADAAEEAASDARQAAAATGRKADADAAAMREARDALDHLG